MITRLENRLANLDDVRGDAVAVIGRLRGELDKANASIGQLFPRAENLADARVRVAELNTELRGTDAHEAASQGAPQGAPGNDLVSEAIGDALAMAGMRGARPISVDPNGPCLAGFVPLDGGQPAG